MNKDNIITLPQKSLRQKSKKIGVITDQVTELIDNMIAATISWEESREHEVAVGLAAIQVDNLYRVFIVRDDFEDAKNKNFTVFINPEIAKKIGPIEEDYEGCLSVPEIYGKVPRYQGVKVKALDRTGKTFRVTAYGFLARIFQHEIDHLNGIVTIDHIKGKKDAFYRLLPEGGLEQIDYETQIKQNKTLWQNNET
ncbi:peptide deformylase [Candidatus Saccharibacteria bacterium]|jgi:peptide deformylase|nr:peptide deformylase [Candidatus Saccharibacteria bacterium]